MTQRKYPAGRRRGFSLFELMIVVAIIAVLAAILLPVISRAKDSGNRTVAMTQAKQLGTGMLIYVEASDNKLPPSTNYAAPEGSKERLWTTVLEPMMKSEKVFIAPGSDGKFASSWDLRGWGTVGYNSSTALDPDKGCNDDDVADRCLAFKTVTSFSKQDQSSSIILFAMTPGGDVKNKYLGYEFSPYNGVPADKPELSPPMASDRDLVAELGGTLPAEAMKPVYARYLANGSDDGTAPLIFGDGHAKNYSAKQMTDPSETRVWRLR